MDWLAARATQNTPALEFDSQTWTYSALNTWVESVAACLGSHGVGRGTRVAIHLNNQPVYAALIHALARIGAIAIPLNTRLTQAEIKWQLAQSGSDHLVCGPELIEHPRRIPVSELLDAPRPSSARTRPEPGLEPVQGIFFTSGTTGFPKGVVLTFGNYHASALASAERLGLEPGDRWLLNMPLHHIGGMSIIFRAAIYGITIVLQPGFDVDALHAALVHGNISMVSLVPTMLHRLLEKYPNFKPAPSLRVILLGGASAPAGLLEKALELNLPIALTYGLTEATSQVATSTPKQTRAKPGSVGKPLSGTTVGIFDRSGKSLPNGEIGEIVVSGKTVMQGYLGMPGSQGELHTGDIGYLDAGGDLWVLTRRTDLIVSGGENIYPEEVERALTSHPCVGEACVVGLPDPEWGQSVAAAVVLRADCDVEALLLYLRGQIAGYKIPRRIVITETLPHTASGKLKRAETASLLIPPSGPTG